VRKPPALTNKLTNKAAATGTDRQAPQYEKARNGTDPAIS
jgi:hypothetical protein